MTSSGGLEKGSVPRDVPCPKKNNIPSESMIWWNLLPAALTLMFWLLTGFVSSNMAETGMLPMVSVISLSTVIVVLLLVWMCFYQRQVINECKKEDCYSEILTTFRICGSLLTIVLLVAAIVVYWALLPEYVSIGLKTLPIYQAINRFNWEGEESLIALTDRGFYDLQHRLICGPLIAGTLPMTNVTLSLEGQCVCLIRSPWASDDLTKYLGIIPLLREARLTRASDALVPVCQNLLRDLNAVPQTRYTYTVPALPTVWTTDNEDHNGEELSAWMAFRVLLGISYTLWGLLMIDAITIWFKNRTGRKNHQ